MLKIKEKEKILTEETILKPNPEKEHILSEDEVMKKIEKLPKKSGDEKIKILREKLRRLSYDYEEKCKAISKIKSIGIKDEENTPPWYIILPTHPAKQVWNIFVYLANFYTLFFLPIDIGVTKGCCMMTSISNTCAIMDAIAAIIFYIDIFFNFFTAIYDKKGLLVLNIKEIAFHYLYSQFPFDMVSSYPYSFTKSSCIIPTPLSKGVIKLFAIFRLQKFGELNRMVEKSNTQYINHFRLLKLLLFFYFVCHFIGCILAGVTTQIYKIQSFLMTADKSVNNFFNMYAFSMLLGISTIINNDPGYINSNEKILVTIFTILSMAITANIFGYVALIIDNINSSNVTNSKMLREKIDLINEYLLYENVDEKLRLEINNFYKFMFIRQRILFDREMYTDLTSSLYAFSKFELWKESYFKKDKLFCRDDITPTFFGRCLNVMMGRMYQKDDIIVEEGESSLDFFMVCTKSRCEVFCSGLLINNLSNGDYFGETASFITSKKRTATVVSKTDGDYIVIPGKQFYRLILDFEKERKFFLSVAKKYLETYNKIITPDKFKSFVTKKGKIFQTVLQENLHINPLVQKNKLFYKVEGINDDENMNQNVKTRIKFNNQNNLMNKFIKHEKLEIFED